MFKINIDLTKSKKIGNVLKIEGIASSSVIDLDGERFSEDAVKKMRDSVVKGNIPIRVEHESKFYSDIGVWKEADITTDGKLFVKGEIDLELSMARDLEVLLRKGVKVCMSVGGRVVDAVSEFVDKAQSWVTTYTDIDLFEISIVKNPANPETNLSLSKSFNVETKEETEVAKSISESAKELIKVPSLKEAIATKSVKEVFNTVKATIKKDCGCTECLVPTVYDPEYVLTQTDLQYIAMFIQASNEFKNQEYTWEEQFRIESDIKSAEDPWDSLGDECYITSLLPYRYFPHHNVDYTINEEWVEYWLWMLIAGKAGLFLTPKEVRMAITHLWQHYLSLNASGMNNESEESKEVQGVKKTSIMEKEMDDSEISAIFKACYEYKTLKKGLRPQIDGNDLSDKEISKMANAYKAINERFRYTQTTASIAKSFYSLSNQDMSMVQKAKTTTQEETSVVVTEEVTPTDTIVETTPIVETPVETPVELAPETAPVAEAIPESVVETTPVVEPTPVDVVTPVQDVVPVVHGVGTVEKNIDGAEDTTPVVVEEVGTDSSLNNTGSEEAVVVSETTPEVSTEGDVLAKAKALIDSAIAEAIAPLATQIATLSKSLEDADSVTKSRDETIQKNTDMLVKSIEVITKGYEALNTQVSHMNSNIALRKSMAVVIEKKDSSSEDLSSADGFSKAVADEMATNGGNFAEARKSVMARLNQA